jgi:tetratricopeptide (TPR) repeat protein
MLIFRLLLMTLWPSGFFLGNSSNWTGEKVLPRIRATEVQFWDGSNRTQQPIHLSGSQWLEVLDDGFGFLRIRFGDHEGWANKKFFVLEKEAAAFFDTRLQTNPSDSWALFMRGYCLYQKGNYDEAIEDLTASIRLNPDDACEYMVRGWAFQIKKEHDLAISDYGTAIRLLPQEGAAFANRGVAWSKKNNLDMAMADLGEAIRLSPKNAHAYCIRGIVWLEHERWQKAVDDFKDAIRLNPKEAESYFLRGYAWLGDKNYEKAIDDFTEGVRLAPGNLRWSLPVLPALSGALPFFCRGSAWLGLRKYDQAISDFTEAIRTAPEFSEAFAQRGSAWEAKGDHNKAITDYTQAIRLESEDSYTMLGRGIASSARKEYDMAIACFSEAIRVNPNNSGPFYRLAWLRATGADNRIRDGKKAIELATKACELTQWHVMTNLECLAAAYAEAGDFQKAVEWQEKALADEVHAKQFGEGARKRLELYKKHLPYHDETGG